MVYALYANGMIGGRDLEREISAINSRFKSQRAELLGDTSDEEYASDDAPLFAAMKPKE